MISRDLILRLWVTQGIILLLVAGAVAQTTNDLTPAQIQGRQLAAEILEQLNQRPDQDSTNTGVLEIRKSGSPEKEIPIRFEIHAPENNAGSWPSIYETLGANKEKLVVTHSPGVGPNQYTLFENNTAQKLAGGETTVPFAGSDFWICDLGLQFFHWPSQKIIKHENRRTRACTVLESTNPGASAGSYSRVVCWIDDETLGIVYAEAYNAGGKLLKEFEPKSFRKVNGQVQLQDMEIRNVQTHSRTRVKFNLGGQ